MNRMFTLCRRRDCGGGTRLEVEVDNPPTGGKLKISVKEFGGAGKRVALLHHANGFCAGTWGLVASLLVKKFHVFAIDARGHGDSEGGEVPRDFDWNYFVSDLLTVANEIRKRRRVKQIDYGIGSSFGGIITAAAEARQPGLFRRIAILDPPIHPTSELVARFKLNIAAENPMKSTLVAQTLKRRRNWPSIDEPRSSWRGKGMFANWTDAAFELYLAECLAHAEDGGVALKCDPAVEAHIFETTGSLAVTDYAAAVHAPVLYIRATDGYVPSDFCRGVASLFGNAGYEEMRGGHLLPLEVPETVARRLLKS